MTSKMASKDPVIRGSLAAMRRAARALAIKIGTPLYGWKDGRVWAETRMASTLNARRSPAA